MTECALRLCARFRVADMAEADRMRAQIDKFVRKFLAGLPVSLEFAAHSIVEEPGDE